MPNHYPHNRGGGGFGRSGPSPGGGHNSNPNPVRSGGQGSDRHLAAPAYLGNLPRSLFAQAAPGHGFRLYLRIWSPDWKIGAKAKKEAVSEVVAVDPRIRSLSTALVSRQRAAAEAAHALILSARASAPFTTGLGMEHPLENGFAFLDPYGLPYLPGSGVKGVLRRAAEELALFEPDAKGWSLPAVWWLFGFDGNSAFFAEKSGEEPKPVTEEREAWRHAYQQHLQRLDGQEKQLLEAFAATASPWGKEKAGEVLSALRESAARDLINHLHLRGALEFWDVIPEPHEGRLRVDIMNPHYNHYYQGEEEKREGRKEMVIKPPGDWGNPVPIYFLTLPPGTGFTFVVRFRPPCNWPEPVREYFDSRWQGLVEAALQVAWELQGFGAKTAVGYGRMRTAERKPVPSLQLPKGPGGV